MSNHNQDTISVSKVSRGVTNACEQTKRHMLYARFNQCAQYWVEHIDTLCPEINQESEAVQGSLRRGASAVATSLKNLTTRHAKYESKDSLVVIPSAMDIRPTFEWMEQAEAHLLYVAENPNPMTEEASVTQHSAFLCPEEAEQRLAVFVAATYTNFMKLCADAHKEQDQFHFKHYTVTCLLLKQLQNELGLSPHALKGLKPIVVSAPQGAGHRPN